MFCLGGDLLDDDRPPRPLAIEALRDPDVNNFLEIQSEFRINDFWEFEIV